MPKEKKILYASALTTLVVLLAVLFAPLGNGRWITAVCLAVLTPIVWLLNKKRSLPQIAKRDVLLITTVIAVLYVVLTQMSGAFMGFHKNPYFVNESVFFSFLLPHAVIIIATELIRRVFLSRDNKIIGIMAYASCVIAETLAFSNLSNVTSFNRFMDLVGLTLFPAISANIYYHYVSKRYGVLPNIVFRLVTTLYVYFIPVVTSMSDSLTACIKIIFPIILLAFISTMFGKEKKKVSRKGKKLGVLATVLTGVFLVLVSMLISCQFRFGALVIATESMTGEINKGDMIIYERYDEQPIKEGQVIIFLQDESKIVHRVVQIQNIGGEVRYYTKGDANEDRDAGYRVESDIFGLTDVKISFIGYPTLWLREMIKN